MNRLRILILLLIFMLAACGGGGDDTNSNSNNTDAQQTDASPTPRPTATPVPDLEIEAPEGYVGPDWLFIPLTDVRTGEVFALASFAGKPTLVLPIGLACRPCVMNQEILRDEIIPVLGTEDYAYVSLSVAILDDVEQLAQYADENNFGWNFARSNNDLNNVLNRAIEFGPNGFAMRNPSALPRIIIEPDGNVRNVQVGQLEPETIIEAMQQLAEGSTIATDGNGTNEATSEAEEDVATEEATAEATESTEG
jgi:cytochrome oxidase Cu insertion factor (SCO1/SenC/PrrC family)